MKASIADLRTRALASTRFHTPVTVTVNEARTVARVELPIDGSASDATSYAALSTLRHEDRSGDRRLA